MRYFPLKFNFRVVPGAKERLHHVICASRPSSLTAYVVKLPRKSSTYESKKNRHGESGVAHARIERAASCGDSERFGVTFAGVDHPRLGRAMCNLVPQLIDSEGRFKLSRRLKQNHLNQFAPAPRVEFCFDLGLRCRCNHESDGMSSVQVLV